MVQLEDIIAARGRIKDVIRHTPLKRTNTLSEELGLPMHFKLENFQRAGSFKVRGATNKMSLLSPDEIKAGVVAASAGNHAQGVAIAGKRLGIPTTVFMPRGASLAKIGATKAYGAEVILQGDDYQGAYLAAVAHQKKHGGTFVHAFDDPDVIAGQGTLGLEILDDLPNVGTVVLPVGGGGLCSGVAIAIKEQRPDVRIVAVQAQGASTLADSLNKGSIQELETVSTLADGIAVRRLGELPFSLMQKYVDEVHTVSEAEISRAILWLLERAKVTVEGAGATTLAAVQSGRLKLDDEPTCLVLSGGNIDMNLVNRIIQNGLVEEGRIAEMTMILADKPGALARLLQELANTGANLLEVRHDRTHVGLPIGHTQIELVMESRGHSHLVEIRNHLMSKGYKID